MRSRIPKGEQNTIHNGHTYCFRRIVYFTLAALQVSSNDLPPPHFVTRFATRIDGVLQACPSSGTCVGFVDLIVVPEGYYHSEPDMGGIYEILKSGNSRG